MQCICNALMCGSAESKLSDLVGLIHSNQSKTSMALAPCKGNYLALMDQIEALRFSQEEETIDLPKALKLLKLSMKNSKELPRIVIITSSLPAEPLTSIAEKVGRLDCIFLRGADMECEIEEAYMSTFCTEHFGKLVSLKPFESFMHTWQLQEELLSQLGISQKESASAFDAKGGSSDASSSRLFFRAPTSRTRSSMRMVDSCRGESLDSFQHLSSDGFAHSWLPSYSNLARKYQEKGFPQHFYLVILDTLCKWQTVFTCRAGRMIVSGRNSSSSSSSARRTLEPLKKQGVLKLMYSSDADSWCMQWKQTESAEVRGLPPLVAKSESKEDEFSVRFTGPSKVKFEAVQSKTGQVLGVHLLSTLYKRQPAFFWLQENFSCEHGQGVQGLVHKLKDLMRRKGQSCSSSCSSKKQSPILALGSDKVPFEAMLLNLMSSSNKPRYQGSKESGEAGSMISRKERKEVERRTEEEEEEEELDKGFYSWTAQLDAELTEDPNLAQIQTSHNIGKESPSTAPQGTDVANDTEDSLLFELD